MDTAGDPIWHIYYNTRMAKSDRLIHVLILF